MSGYAHPKWYYQLVENVRVYLQEKKLFSSSMLFWIYCNDIQTSYFGYFGHAWLHKPKMIASTCRRLRCLSACQKYTSSLTSFLRYCILKNFAIWLADNILVHNSRTRSLSDINNNISFHFRLFSRKTNNKLFKNSKKTCFGAILSPFCPNLGKNEFSWKKRLSQFLNIPIIYHRPKKPEKTDEPFLRKMPNWRMNRRTDRQMWFFRTLRRTRGPIKNRKSWKNQMWKKLLQL